jgi:GNAT superfamily N-acetyltransferase
VSLSTFYLDSEAIKYDISYIYRETGSRKMTKRTRHLCRLKQRIEPELEPDSFKFIIVFKSNNNGESSEMFISYIKDVPECIIPLAQSIVEHWRYVLLKETVDSRVRKLQQHMNRTLLPIAWVAHSEFEVFGTAALRVHDLDDRKDLTPWLGGVFVRPEYRNRGIASFLCRVVEEKAWSLGFNSLYLHTPDQQSLYVTLGWQFLEPASWRGYSTEIMIKTKRQSEKL